MLHVNKRYPIMDRDLAPAEADRDDGTGSAPADAQSTTRKGSKSSFGEASGHDGAVAPTPATHSTTEHR